MLITRTPYRISFLGGGTDYPQWYLKNNGMVLSTTIDKYSYITLNDLDNFLPNFDLLINATSVGHIENKDITLIPLKLLLKAKNTMVVYDIIYDPLKTTLLKNSEEIGLRTINGLRMNLIQAVLAYSYTNQTVLAKEEIYKIMK